MHRVDIKPMSVNVAYRSVGNTMRKSAPYRQYEKDVSLLLPKLGKLDGKLKLKLEFGFSNKNSDIDNPVKPFQDIMQKKYGFNDSQIYALSVTKTIVKKGEEFIKFEILKN